MQVLFISSHLELPSLPCILLVSKGRFSALVLPAKLYTSLSALCGWGCVGSGMLPFPVIIFSHLLISGREDCDIHPHHSSHMFVLISSRHQCPSLFTSCRNSLSSVDGLFYKSFLPSTIFFLHVIPFTLLFFFFGGGRKGGGALLFQLLHTKHS